MLLTSGKQHLQMLYGPQQSQLCHLNFSWTDIRVSPICEKGMLVRASLIYVFLLCCRGPT